MNKLLIATAAVALATAGTAGAADLPYKAPPMQAVAPVQTWTGCWVSGGVGYGMWNQESHEETNPGLVSLNNTDVTHGGRGWLGRVGVGCDYQFASSFVIGAFGDYDWANIHGTFDSENFLLAGNEKLSRQWAAGGRIGYLPSPNLLTFISGGWTEARFDGVTLSSTVGPAVALDTFPSNDYRGWFIGGGYEYQVPWAGFNGLYWKTEYRYSNFRTADLAVSTIAGLNAGFAEHMQKYEQTVTTSLVWRFNWGGPVVARY